MMNIQQVDELEAAKAKNWNTIYPIYINKEKTIAEGRRVPKEKGVTTPNILEIGEICKYFQLNCLIEPRKAYPRDWLHPGRVKVQLFKDNGDPANPQIKSISKEDEFLLKLCELIPKLKSRVAPAATTQEQAVQGGGSKKKKNKK